MKVEFSVRTSNESIVKETYLPVPVAPEDSRAAIAAREKKTKNVKREKTKNVFRMQDKDA